MANSSAKKISVTEAMSIGIGGMVGGGIFAVLGLAVSLAKGSTPLAFLVAGLVAALTAYSYAKLSQRYPDRGGTVRFLNEGYGRGVFSGAMNNLLWLSYIIMLSLYASAFGSYAPNLWSITGNHTADFHLYASAIIIIATLINYYSIAVVSRIEQVAVVVKLVILLAFVVIGALGLFTSGHVSQLGVSNWESPIHLFAGGMVIFVAYEGFELIANAAPDIEKPQKNIARAYAGAVGFVIALYFVIAIVTVGSLSFASISKAQDYVLAEAAKPMLGQTGFVIITIAALISTFSAINASLYGGAQVNYEIAEDGELPHGFLSIWRNQPIGLAITALATLVAVNVLHLESISTAGSVGFLLIFGIVNLAAFRLAKPAKANRIITGLGAALCFVATIILIGQQWRQNLVGVIVALGLIIFCGGVELWYQNSKKAAKYRAKSAKLAAPKVSRVQ
ncbi:amino acid transporter [Boudabousia tangfeifanii]|uniref:Amino acid transporter n=1 Tax=Boudabousia tangfeifanii TaxID=1912795 RepID=A0A1D9MI55_9ACTO|nr:APC family permease [Boudabousia tangfeifanii]AOZ71893.1 amino acid transporter [Boudabousia tangfeifanii]